MHFPIEYIQTAIQNTNRLTHFAGNFTAYQETGEEDECADTRSCYPWENVKMEQQWFVVTEELHDNKYDLSRYR
jgi:hypothetical protein